MKNLLIDYEVKVMGWVKDDFENGDDFCGKLEEGASLGENIRNHDFHFGFADFERLETHPSEKSFIWLKI